MPVSKAVVDHLGAHAHPRTAFIATAATVFAATQNCAAGGAFQWAIGSMILVGTTTAKPQTDNRERQGFDIGPVHVHPRAQGSNKAGNAQLDLTVPLPNNLGSVGGYVNRDWPGGNVGGGARIVFNIP